jgi:hypothetical protein
MESVLKIQEQGNLEIIVGLPQHIRISKNADSE